MKKIYRKVNGAELITKELFPPEKCPKCGADTVVMHFNNGYRVECPNNPKCTQYGEFHFDVAPNKK